MTFEQFLMDAAARGEAVNLVFEKRLFDLVEVLYAAADTLSQAGVGWQLIGGAAVLVYVEEADPSRTLLTGNIDLMVGRACLDRVRAAAEGTGTARILVRIHSTDRTIAPVTKRILGKEVRVIPLLDLVRMKLSAFRLKDQVHIQIMDAAGLIPPEIESHLDNELRDRLQRIRQTE